MASSDPTPERLRRLRHLLLGGLAGGAIALAVGAIALVLWARDETPPLTRDRCEAAYRRWQEHAPSGYSLKVRIGGAREADVVVEVRDDRVETMTYNGIVPRTASMPSAGKGRRPWGPTAGTLRPSRWPK